MSRLHYLSLSTTYISVVDAFDKPVSHATAFFWISDSSKLYLITNWHVVTGRFTSNPRESQTGAIPCVLKLRLYERYITNNGKKRLNLKKYSDFDVVINSETGNDPQWLEHPNFRSQVDIIAIEMDVALHKRYIFNAVNKWPGYQEGYLPEPMDDVFVIGYPWGLSTHKGGLPLYKRGCIASDPVVNYGSLPRILIDCRTATGMSGSPVIASHSGLYHPDGELTASSVVGTVSSFVGIYSGRMRDQSFGQNIDIDISEIGIVWKRSILEEILLSGVKGTCLEELSS